MRVISLIDDGAVIRKILRQLGLWAPQQTPRAQIGPPTHDPPGQFTPVLTYHTGQHYDREMNDVFFEELGIPEPDLFMAAGGGSHSQQTAKIMVAFEELCQGERPDAVLVEGDVNSTLACSIVAKKLNIPVAHVEAGLRSGSMTMPEEINRLVTDSISDWFFVTEPSAVAHLQREGKADSAIHYVGHVMVDNALYQADKLTRTDTSGFETSAFKAAHTADGGRRHQCAGRDRSGAHRCRGTQGAAWRRQAGPPAAPLGR